MPGKRQLLSNDLGDGAKLVDNDTFGRAIAAIDAHVTDPDENAKIKEMLGITHAEPVSKQTNFGQVTIEGMRPKSPPWAAENFSGRPPQ